MVSGVPGKSGDVLQVTERDYMSLRGANACERVSGDTAVFISSKTGEKVKDVPAKTSKK